MSRRNLKIQVTITLTEMLWVHFKEWWKLKASRDFKAVSITEM